MASLPITANPFRTDPAFRLVTENGQDFRGDEVPGIIKTRYTVNRVKRVFA